MSNKEDLEQEFANWLDGKPSDVEVDESSVWQQRKNTAHFIQHQVEMNPSAEVPHWDRASSFHSDKVPFWQWRGLPVLSMAFSMFAIALVLFKVELVMQDGGILLSFADNNSQLQQQKMVKLVDEKLKDFAQEQQILLTNYAADIKVQQQDNNLQLASYIMGASRQERKEDISDFIQYINAQRKDELLDQKIKYQQLEQAIKYNKVSQRENINGFGMNQEYRKASHNNLTSEE